MTIVLCPTKLTSKVRRTHKCAASLGVIRIMTQPYRLRIKTAVKIKIGLLVLAGVLLLAAILWQLVNSDLFKREDRIEFKNYQVVTPESVRKTGKNGFYKHVAIIKLPSGKFTQLQVTEALGLEGKYCIAESYKNGHFVSYINAEFDKCV